MEEEIVEEEKKEYISYLFNTKKTYTVTAQANGGRIFYKIAIRKKASDGQELKNYMPIRFAKCEPVPDNTKIRIKNAMEDWYVNPKDTWNIVPVLVIFDYEIIENTPEEAIQNFNSANINYTDDLPF